MSESTKLSVLEVIRVLECSCLRCVVVNVSAVGSNKVAKNSCFGLERDTLFVVMLTRRTRSVSMNGRE